MRRYLVLALVIAAIAAIAVPSYARTPADAFIKCPLGSGGTDAVDLSKWATLNELNIEVAGTLPATALGNGITDAQVSNVLTINSGPGIDNTPIGASIPSTGAFTNLSVSGTFTSVGVITAPASTTATAGFILTPGVDVTAPSDGMMWATTENAYIQISGNTIPLGVDTPAGFAWSSDGTILSLKDDDAPSVMLTITDAGTTGNLGVTGTLAVTGTSALTGNVTLAGDLAVNGADVTSTALTVNVFNATTTKVNLGGNAAVDLGKTALATTVKGTFNVDEAGTFDTTLGVTGNTTLTGDLAVNGNDITSTGATVQVFDTGVTKLNIGGAAAVDLSAAGLATIAWGTFNAKEAATFNTTVGVTGATTLSSTLDVTGAAGFAGTVTLDDGVTHSPSLVLKDSDDETGAFSKLQGAAGSGYTTFTTLADDGLNVLVGNFKVGAGTPDVTLNGVDIFGSGTLEVDGATRLDGAVTANSTLTLADTLQVNEEVAIDLNANDEEFDLTTTAVDYAADSAAATIYMNGAGQTNNFYGLRIRHKANADAQDHFIVCEDNDGTDRFKVNSGGDTTVGGTLTVTGSFAPTTLTLTPFELGVDTGVLEIRDGEANNMATITDFGTFGGLTLPMGYLGFTGPAITYSVDATTDVLQFSNGVGACTMDGGTFTGADVVGISYLRSGADDTQAGVIVAYDGGSLFLYNSHTGGSLVDYWKFRALSDLTISTVNNQVLAFDDVTLSATFSGKVVTPASAAVAGAGLNLPHGTAPNTPVNGDKWITTLGEYAYINGGTVGPYIDSTTSDLTIDDLFKLDTDTGVFEFSDGTNNMFTVTDNGTTGTVAVSAALSAVTGLSVTAGNLTVAAITDVTNKISRDQGTTTVDLVEIETTNASDDHAALLIDANSTGAVDAVEIETAGTAAGLHITTEAAAGSALDIDVANTMTGRALYADLGPWIGTVNQGAIEVVTDAAATAVVGQLLRIDQNGTAQHATAIDGTVGYFADAAAAPVAGTSYAVTIDATNIEALHVDTGAVLFDEGLTVTGNLVMNGASITGDDATVGIFDSVVTKLDIGGAAAIDLSVAGSDTSVKGTLSVIQDSTLTGDLAVNGGDVTSTALTMNLFNATVTKLNVGGVAAIDLSGTGLATTVKGTLNVDEAVTLDTTLGVTGNTTLTGDIAVNGGDITSTAGTLTLGNNNAVDISKVNSLTTVKGTLNVDQFASFDAAVEFLGAVGGNISQFAEDDAHPNISSDNVFRCYGKEGLTITNFDGTQSSFSQEITIFGAYLNEIQTVIVTNGNDTDSFTLTYSGQTTASLLWDCTAAQMKTALEALNNIAVDDVTVVLAPAGTYTVTFQGDLAETDVAQMTSTPTTCDVAHATTTIGGGACTSTVADNATILLDGAWTMDGANTLTLVWDYKKNVWREKSRGNS